MEQYEPISSIGHGSSSEVFLMRNSRTKQLFAVKKVRTVPGKRLRSKEAVLREVAILRQLQHPHVVACHGHFLDSEEAHIFIVQEYCAGGSLDQHIRKGGPFSEGLIMQWLVQLALAVQYIHGLNILHRDIKASNVFLTQKWILKLGDFGISRVMDGTLELATTFVGTPYYLSPELCRDRPYSSKADIWALGCLLFEMCALQPPFQAFSLIGLCHKIVNCSPNPVPVCYSVPLQSLVQTILQKDPKARPSASSILALPYVQEHLSLYFFRRDLQQPGKLPQEALPDGQGATADRPEADPKGTLDFLGGEAGAPGCAPLPLGRGLEDGLSACSSGSQYSADGEDSSTSSIGSSSDGDVNTDDPEPASETSSGDDLKDSEEAALEEAMDNLKWAMQESKSSSAFGSLQRTTGDGDFGGSDSSSFTSKESEHLLRSEDSEHVEVCSLLQNLDLEQ